VRRVLSWSCLLVAALAVPGCAGAGDDPVRAAAPSAVATSAAPSSSAGPTPGAGAKIPVVASANFYGDLAQRIGGDRVEVTSIITSANQDPHSFEANTRTQLALSAARVVIKNGGHYDDFMDTLLSSVSGERAVLTAVAEEEGAEEEGAGAHEGESEEEHAGHAEGEANEHVWYDLAAMDALAGRIADELSTVAPESRDYFQANAAELRSGLSALRARQDALKATYGGQKVAVTEPVPLYLVEAVGLENVTPAEFTEGIEEGSDIPVRVLQETVDLMTKDRIRALVYNDQTTGPQTEQVRTAAERNGVPVVAVTETLPEGKDFLSWMGANLDALAAALGAA
jgi:zinc/manganese transport system substrate-binding protein